MIRLKYGPQWILLIPYFWVKSWNVRGWFTDDRPFVNRVNGLCFTALAAALPLGGTLYAIGFRQLPYSQVYAVVCFLGCLTAITIWLNREREQRYAAIHKTMPVGIRFIFGVAALALTAWPFWEIPRRHQPTSVQASISCPKGADELTEECS